MQVLYEVGYSITVYVSHTLELYSGQQESHGKQAHCGWVEGHPTGQSYILRPARRKLAMMTMTALSCMSKHVTCVMDFDFCNNL